MAKPARLVIDHEDALAALATWWKAIFLTPVWACIVIMPVGVLVRSFAPAYTAGGFLVMLMFGLVYFARDLAKRRIIIDDANIHFGLMSFPLAQLDNVEVVCFDTTWSFVPIVLHKSLRLKFKDGQCLELMLNRLSNDALDQLIEVIGRKVTHCRIDPDVETVLRRRRPVTILRLENPDKFEAQYHSSRLLEELPAVLKHTVYTWARVVGPVGTLILCLPLWMVFNLEMYHVLRNYANVEANQQFYNNLVAFLASVITTANSGLVVDRDLSMAIASSPAVAFICICAAIWLAVHMLASVLGANRLTVDRDEISLDRFFNLFSYTQEAAKWKDVQKVLLDQPRDSADPNRAVIKFLDDHDQAIMKIKLASLSTKDREKLSLAIIKFAGQSHVSSNLTEALEPSQNKSYTELWLKSLSETPARKNLEPLAAGHLLEGGRYEISKKLAVGGEGVAYLGRDLKDLASGHSEQVVLKETLIPPFVEKQVQQRALERFEREARLLKELKSEYVVGLRDYFIEDHRCYLVLDYVEGQNLRQHIYQHGPLDEAKVLDLTKQMCAMLDFLHQRSVIHRDFTPDNLILQEDGRLKLIDFNVARESDEGKTGTIVGKHAYVPPEQFRGKPTRQSDLYALGATLHFLLVGHDPEPISQSSPAAIQKHVSAAMDVLVQKCTALDQTKRPSSIAEVLSACQAISEVTAAETVTESNGLPESNRPSQSDVVSIKIPTKKKKKVKVKAALKEKAN